MALGAKSDHPAVQVDRVWRTYRQSEHEVVALRDLTIQVDQRECVAICGPSGSGKTTLLNLIAGMDRPSQGSISVFGDRIDRLPDSELAAFRARSIGFVFQEPHLFPGLTALENVSLARLPWERGRVVEVRARELLHAVGLADRIHHPPSKLSGGERQRVGIARALVGTPRLLLADEPTGNLDQATTRGILTLLRSIQEARDLTMIIVTHDTQVAAMAGRTVAMDPNRSTAPNGGGARA